MIQQANLNPNRYGRLEIAVPPIQEQREIVLFLNEEIKKLQGISEVLKYQIDKLTEYKKSLIHECVTGKKRIYQG